MADLELNPTTGDLLVTNNALTLIDGADAIKQHLTIRFRFFLGEWPLDQRLGVPYYDQILVKNPDLVAIRGIFRQVILTTPGVSALESFETEFIGTTRTLTITFVARLTDSDELLTYDKEFIL